MKINPDYPIWINPDFTECLEIVNRGFDTLRVLVNSDDHGVYVASGYGHTHHSVSVIIRQHLKKKRHFTVAYIIYEEQGKLWFNLEDVNGKEKVDYRQAVKHCFDDEEALVFWDILQAWEDAQRL